MLIVTPTAGVEEIAQSLSLPEPAVRSALASLADLTLLRVPREAPGQLRPVAPEHGLSILISRQEAELHRRKQEIEAQRARIALAAEALRVQAILSAPSQNEHIVGHEAVDRRFEELMTGTKSEVMAAFPGGPTSAYAVEAGHWISERLAREHVTVHILYQSAMRFHSENVSRARQFLDLGSDVRTAPTLPSTMVLIDRIIGVLPRNESMPGSEMIIVREMPILVALVALFERTWNTAVALNEEIRRDRITGLTPDEQELLRLLASGITDESAADRLGVSRRTVQRKMSELMKRLGATSRFDAGFRASRHGWI